MYIIKRTKSGLAFDIVNHILLTLLVVFTIYPVIFILALSLNNGFDTLKGGIWLIPRQFTLDNYVEALKDKDIVNSFVISIARTLTGTSISVLFIAMLAYALCDKKLPGRGGIIKFFFITTIFSGGLIPFFILLRDLKLINSFWVYILPAVYSFYNMIIVRAYFENIPGSLAESAKIDGAGEVRIFFQMYIPLSLPILATIALFTGVFHWNDWFAGSFYVSRRKLMPAATLLQLILSESTFEQSGMSNINNMMNSSFGGKMQTTTPQSLQMAFVMIITIPIVLVYPFLQKYFVKGMMIGALKG